MKIIIEKDNETIEFKSPKKAIKYLKQFVKKEKKESSPSAKFFHIGGYELLRDGTKEEKIKGIENLKSFLRDEGISFDKEIIDFYEIIDSIEDEWTEKYNDGGGSGWIEH